MTDSHVASSDGRYQRYCATIHTVKNTAVLGSTVGYNGDYTP